MRLAETYLLRSEAYFWNDQPDQAADDLNAVRTRAGCAPYTTDQINIGTILMKGQGNSITRRKEKPN